MVGVVVVMGLSFSIACVSMGCGASDHCRSRLISVECGPSDPQIFITRSAVSDRQRVECAAVRRPRWLSLFVILAVLPACRAEVRPPPAAVPTVVSSNVLRQDYAGSKVCGDCHSEIHESFQGSAMHRMTRLPAHADVKAPFDVPGGTLFRFKDDQVTLEKRGERRFMTLASERFGSGLYEVTKVIGGRHREDFAGVAVSREAPHAPLGQPDAERVLPVSYLIGPQRLRLKGYSVLVKERPGIRVGGAWNETCIFCHNTAPYLSTVLGALAGPGAPGYQGQVVDRFLPKERRWTYRPGDRAVLRRALADEAKVLDGDLGEGTGLREQVRTAVQLTKKSFRARHLIEVGIGCESCHLGSKEHVKQPKTHPSLLPVGAAVHVGPAGGGNITRAQAINRTCARCHAVLFSRYPYTWEGGRRASDAGGSHINSGEARDFLLGACQSQLACTRCHDPHATPEKSRRRMAELEGPAGIALCTTCHTRLATPTARAAHTHHKPDGAGSHCLSCHMPRKNLGLVLGLTRYHRIGSPTDPARVLHDRPLECALCHANHSVEQLVSTMEKWWGKSYDRARLRELYGDLSARSLLATLQRGLPHEQVTAVGALGELKNPDAATLAAMADQLSGPYPLAREVALAQLERVLGRKLSIDVHAPLDDIRRQARSQLAVGTSQSTR
jgi:predicted CXXCH cytochrome family protein